VDSNFVGKMGNDEKIDKMVFEGWKLVYNSGLMVD
tara:strand:+ start:646 stop:750 length:105 start_codon:yes stop_codon:yes gene_type:complete